MPKINLKNVFPRRLQFISIFLMIFIPIWSNLPGMTEDMFYRPGYYLWSKKLSPLNETIYRDFIRDSEYQKSLIGQPIDVLVPIFPELTKAVDYNSDSYRGKASLAISKHNKVSLDDIYWLRGEETYGGVYAIIKQNKIVEIKLIKG